MAALSIKAERLNRGLGPDAAAGEIGVSKSTLLRAEETGAMPNPQNAYKIATFYGYKVTEIWPIEVSA